MRALAIGLSLLLLAGTCSAQMDSGYNTYDNMTVDIDADGHITGATLTVLLEGNTFSTGNPFTYHTGTVNAYLAGQAQSNSIGPVFPNYYMEVSASVSVPISDACFNSENGCYGAVDAEVFCDIAGSFFYRNSVYGVRAADCGCIRSQTGDICRYSCTCVPQLYPVSDEPFWSTAGDLNTACAKAGHPIAGCPTLVDLLRVETYFLGWPQGHVDDVVYCHM